MKEEQIRYYTQIHSSYWVAEDEGVTLPPYEQGAPRRSTMMPQRWEVVDGMLKPTDKLSPTKKKITHKMDMT